MFLSLVQMTTLLEKSVEVKLNSLNAIRLALALLVIFSHSYPLSGTPSPDPLSFASHGQDSFGILAVNLFFLISGMLITSSWLRSKSMQDYLMKRFLRIYPGYIVAMLFSSFLIYVICPDFRFVAKHG